MRTFFIGAGVLAVLAAVPPMTTDKIPAAGGDIEITPIMHASVQVEHAGKVIHIDPWRKGDYSKAKQADLILVTDTPDHHFDLEAIRMLRKSGAPVLISAAVRDKLANGTVIANRERKTVAGVSVEAIPMYGLKPGEPIEVRLGEWYPR
jgi:L-ascorbate metabolism protein UlaG (beta-lactamase superfamily)